MVAHNFISSVLGSYLLVLTFAKTPSAQSNVCKTVPVETGSVEIEGQFSIPIFDSQQSQVTPQRFGAIADGINDDTRAWNEAVTYCIDNDVTLVVPAGTYYLGSLSSSTSNAHVQARNRQVDKEANLIIKAKNGATVKTDQVGTSVNGSRIIEFRGKFNKIHIENLAFKNSHGLTTLPTNAIFPVGDGTQNVRNMLIQQCKFDGFSTSIVLIGIDKVLIDQCIFTATRGHDQAQTNSHPAVHIWGFDNDNGYVGTAQITNNVADGLAPSVNVSTLYTKKAMDGFVYGVFRSVLISSNKLRNFSEEAVALSPTPTHHQVTEVSHNLIDCKIPVGSINTKNYGVRCDVGHAVIKNNVITDATFGIMLRAFDYPQLKIANVNIANNKITSVNNMSKAIMVQGSEANPTMNHTIAHNVVILTRGEETTSASGIFVSDCIKSMIRENIIISDTMQRLRQHREAIALQRTDSVQLVDNHFFSARVAPTTRLRNSNMKFSGSEIVAYKQFGSLRIASRQTTKYLVKLRNWNRTKPLKYRFISGTESNSLSVSFKQTSNDVIALTITNNTGRSVVIPWSIATVSQQTGISEPIAD